MNKDDSFSGSNPFLRDITERLKEINVDRLVSMPASRFPTDALTDIYNESRKDYIIPLPMSASQLAEYIDIYDLQLSDSVVIMDTVVGQLVGMGLLGLRGKRAWISRFGIVSMLRETDIGNIIFEYLVSAARYKGATAVETEFIVGDSHGEGLAKAAGFDLVETVLVGRRPPDALADAAPGMPAAVMHLSGNEAFQLLEDGEAASDWRNEIETFAKLTDRLEAIKVDDLSVVSDVDGGGWIVFESPRFQLNRIRVHVSHGDPALVTGQLLHHLHTLHPKRDARTINLPVDHPCWAGFQTAGYFESFRRNRYQLSLVD